jgi:hypothetical protein
MIALVGMKFWNKTTSNFSSAGGATVKLDSHIACLRGISSGDMLLAIINH